MVVDPSRPGSDSFGRTQPTAASRDVEILSVSDLNHRARLTLENEFRTVWVMGEMSNFARPRSGHWYFSLKDDANQVRCAMFANRNRAVQLQPGDGQLVLIRGRATLYENRGDFQIIVDYMEPAGAGELQRAFEALKVKLSAVGLFAADRKRPLPPLPEHCAVITSPTGAALRDVLAVWRRRYPTLRVTLIPSSVQGERAEAELNDAFAALASLHLVDPVDAVLVTRGGGSLEDLWSFNLESIAHAIAASPVPVVSAVGHEIDITIADLVADVRAPTPSAAAEIVVPDRGELQTRVASLSNRLQGLLDGMLAHLCLELGNLALQLPRPMDQVERNWLRLDDLQNRIGRLTQGAVERAGGHLGGITERLRAHSPGRQLDLFRLRVGNAHARARRAFDARQRHADERLKDLARLLNNLSPLPTLSRGFAVLIDEHDKAVVSHTQVAAGTRIRAWLANGQLTATVEETKEHGLDKAMDGEP